jgi:4-aminobutyrate aminotransferase
MSTKTNAKLMERRQNALPRGVGQAHPIFVTRAENTEVWDVEGRRYIDFAGGIAVVNTGHRHPKVVAAAQKQLEAFTHTCFQVLAYEPLIELAERLNQAAPGNFAKKTFFMTTGAEAVENAVKIARSATGRSGIIAFNGGFHGRTMMGMALTGKVEPYKAGFGPFPAEVFHAPYPDALHGVTVDDAIAGVEALFKYDIEASRVAAIIVEPVQGEGGYIPAPTEFFQRLRALCDKHGILLIADEVQTGIGRTGKLFAMEHHGVAADITTLAKGLGGGFTLSAIVGKAEIMDGPNPGGLGGTYAGNPVAIAAALAVLDVVEEEKLCDRSAAIGERIKARFKALAQKHDVIADVRGLGAMVGVELCHGGDVKKPAADVTKAVIAEAAKRGLVLLSCGSYGNVLRLMLPLTVSDEILAEGLDIIEASFEAVKG